MSFPFSPQTEMAIFLSELMKRFQEQGFTRKEAFELTHTAFGLKFEADLAREIGEGGENDSNMG